MPADYDIQDLIKLRQQTRAASDLLKAHLSDFLDTLSPLLRPHPYFGEYLQGAPRGPLRESQAALNELRERYDKTARRAPFNLVNDLEPPLEVLSSAPHLYPVEYRHQLDEHKAVTITSPLKWVVGYAGFDLARFRALVADPNRSSAELQRFVLHYLLMYYILSKRKGLSRLFEGLRFPLSFVKLPEFGELPLCVLASEVRTQLPDAQVIRNSTEISGSNSFEEIVIPDNIVNLGDPLREHLLHAIG